MSIAQAYPRRSHYAHARFTQRARVLVVSAHPDDDVLGCGAAVRRFALRGAHVCAVYVTDGSASHVKSKRFPPAVLRDVRETEAREALRLLGVGTPPRFLRAPDGGLAQLDALRRAALVRELVRTIDRLRPHLVFAPWPRDPHPDHIATAELVQAALDRSVRRPTTYFYRVWLPVRGTAADGPQAAEALLREIALSPLEVCAKRAAIMAHRSQTTDLIDDDPEGFRIDAALLARWLTPVERFYRRADPRSGWQRTMIADRTRAHSPALRRPSTQQPPAALREV